MKRSNIIPFRWIVKDDLLHRVRKSVSDFTAVFANLELTHEHPWSGPDGFDGTVTAVIGFDGAYQGAVWARCDAPLAVRIAAGVWGDEPDGVDEKVLDALGEMINILGGDLKLFLSPGGRDVTLTLPSVFQGDDLFAPDFTQGPENLFCSFLHQDERLLVGVTLKKVLAGHTP